MIPKLCTDITDTNGLGRLADVISVSIKQELNGAYELTMTYPITGALYDQIEVDRLIGTRSGEGSGVQYFRIVRISRPINGIVSIYAQHYSYQLNYVHVPPCTVTGTVQSCLDQLKALCIEGCDFTLTSELANVMTVVVEKPTALRSVIGGMDGSILEQLHAEALWDNDTVVIKSALVPTVIGQRNVALRYGKNIADLEAEDSIEAFYSGVLPYWQKEVDGVDVYVQGSIQYSQAQGAFDYERIYALDLSSDFEDQPSVADLNAAGASFVSANNVGVVVPSITATPAQIWETKEYAALAGIESLRLGSMTDIIYNRLRVNATAEVVETVWDGLLERYSSMTFGAPRANVVDDIVNMAAPTIQKAGGGGGSVNPYPVGSIYLSVNNVNPSTLFGGTWEQIQDTFLLAAGSTFAAGDIGGAQRHTHNYGIQYGGYYRGFIVEYDNSAGLLKYDSSGNVSLQPAPSDAILQDVSISVNNNLASAVKTIRANHYRIESNTSYGSNLPPYLAVYVWKRVA